MHALKFNFDTAPYQFLRHLSQLPQGFRGNDPYCLLGAVVIAVGLDGQQKPVCCFYLNADQWDGVVLSGHDVHGGELVTANSVKIPPAGELPQLVPYLVPSTTLRFQHPMAELETPLAVDGVAFVQQRLAAVARAQQIERRYQNGECNHGLVNPPQRKRELRQPWKLLAKLLKPLANLFRRVVYR